MSKYTLVLALGNFRLLKAYKCTLNCKFNFHLVTQIKYIINMFLLQNAQFAQGF